MMTARKYANYDSTLPVYDKNNLGDMIVGLKAALITGYQEVKPAGWELVYESLSSPNDTSKRIAVRSKAVDSEQKVFEIEDISNIEGSIKCWENWSGNAGVNLLIQGKINKNSWDNRIEIIADAKFVHMIINGVYSSFGDCDVFKSADVKTIVFAMNNTDNNDTSQAIASTSNPSRIVFKDITSNILICRSFCHEQNGYSSRINWQQSPVYDVFNSGDTGAYASNIETPVRATELLKVKSVYNVPYAYLPNMFYTDNPITMGNNIFTINGVNKKLVNCAVACAGVLSFAVDA